jgi:hypothetical protein
MIKFITLSVVFITAQFAILAEAHEYLLNNCRNLNTWSITLGGEFPGAKGTIKLSKSGCLKVNYDFSKGGKYIAVWPHEKLPVQTKNLCFKIVSDQDCRMNYRIVDASGRYFQGRSKLIKNGAQKMIFNSNGPWSGAWGGKKSPVPARPFKNVFLMISKDKKLPLKGTVLLEAFYITSDKKIANDFTGKNISLRGCGWMINASWIPKLTGGMLKLAAKNCDGKDAELSITFPEAGRNKVFRKKLSKSSEIIYYIPPLKNGGNVYNKYKLILKISNTAGTEAQTVLTMAGNKSDKINFGVPVKSRQIKNSKIGVCTHFSFGRMPHWPYWAPYKELIKGITQCGYKWVRDGCHVEKKKDGSYKVCDYDLRWMKYAKKHGLNIILVIRLYPDKSLEEYKKYVEAVVNDTKGLVDVYELGNEPGNFGWQKKFGGHWNGYDPSTKNVDKWVTEHLKYTNALANHMRKIAPDITIIGVGAASPTNFLVMKLGVSKNVDGIVDHPYTYSMPPEKIPFCKNHKSRDGVIVSENGSFEELVKAYEKLFKDTGKMRSLWLTEFGFTTFWFSGKNEKKLYAGFTEQAQAVYIVRRFIQTLALPIVAVSCQYDYLDDYFGREYNPEANFGIIRVDHSRKPAYFAIQRMNSLFNGYSYDSNAKVIIEQQPLHRSCKRSELIKSWDKVRIDATNEIKALPFIDADNSNQRMLAVWSTLPYSREFNNRVCTVKIVGWNEFDATPVGIDIIDGSTFDVPMNVKDNSLILDGLSLKGHPIVIKFIKSK